MNKPSPRKPLDECLISVILPVYNEVAVLRELTEQVTCALSAMPARIELIFVNDGSSDGSAELLDSLTQKDARLRVLHLSRNFGHQAALHAGLEHAAGDAVIVMDSDMQDAPQCLNEFVRKWQTGFDVVYAIREKRKEGFAKRMLFWLFYRVLRWASATDMPHDAGNFGLIDRQVLRNVLHMGEYDRYYAGLRSWVGFRQTGVTVERLARHDETPRVSFFGLCSLAKTALFSFSSAPLALFYGIACVSLLVLVCFSGFSLYHKFVTGLAIPGWTSSVMIAAFFGALNALGIGILGEYVVRIYDQVRARPKYIVARETRQAGLSEAGLDLNDQLTETLADVAALRAAVSGTPTGETAMHSSGA